MSPEPPAFRPSLQVHAAAKGAELRARHPALANATALAALLGDRDFVRYPCVLRFDAGPLLPGECAYALPLGERPEDGFAICVHPHFGGDWARVVPLVLYQVAAVNYGVFAAPADAEAFGAGALGLDVDSYYRILCELSDELYPPDPGTTDAGGGACPGGDP